MIDWICLIEVEGTFIPLNSLWGICDRIIAIISLSDLQLIVLLNLVMNNEFNNVSKFLRDLIDDVTYTYVNILANEWY